MAKGKRFIKGKYMPPKLPIYATAVVWLVLDRIKPNDLILGVVWTLWGLFALLCTVSFFWQLTTWSASTPVWDDSNE